MPKRRLLSPAAAFLLLPALLLAGRLTAQTPTPNADAQQTMAQAESVAKASDKRILLDFGASWCGNCHLWDHFIDDRQMRPILDKYFVMVTLISGEHDGDTRHSNTPGAQQFEDSIGGKGAGWPYIIILDDAGKPIVNNYRPEPKAKSGRVNIAIRMRLSKSTGSWRC